jgi:multiple sugar transport system ATP-binding protein
VADNMGFALKIAGMDKGEIRKRVEEAAKILDLEQYLDRKPKALSGGQRQRVAMGRAIVRQPQCFLMDEPLSNLDAKLRVQTRTQIASLQRRLGTTTVYVTHDQVEAMTMGDRVALLKDGILQQVDSPRNLYDRPGNTFVAGFIGSPAMNIFEAQLSDEGARIGEYTVPVLRDARATLAEQGAKSAILGFRPESVTVVPPGEGFPFEVAVVEELGSDAYAYGNLHFGDDAAPLDKMFIARVDARKPPSRGETIHLKIRESEEHVFNPDTGERVGGASNTASSAGGSPAAAHRG